MNGVELLSHERWITTPPGEAPNKYSGDEEGSLIYQVLNFSMAVHYYVYSHRVDLLPYFLIAPTLGRQFVSQPGRMGFNVTATPTKKTIESFVVKKIIPMMIRIIDGA